MNAKRIKLTEEARSRVDYESAKENARAALRGLEEMLARMTTPSDPMHYGHIKEINLFAQEMRGVLERYITY